jgi:hypothetical protein
MLPEEHADKLTAAASVTNPDTSAVRIHDQIIVMKTPPSWK